MAAKTMLITGGTSGIGYQTALQLAKTGAHIFVTGRNKTAGEAAIAALREASGNPHVDLLLGDLANQTEVRAIAAQFTQHHSSLDVLINNAGLAATERRLTTDGIEANFAVNVVAPWLLSSLLTPALQASPAARIITLTGGSHPARIEFDNLQSEREFVGLTAYSHAKLIMMAVMYEFAQRMAETSITVNVCYPGQASTVMTQQVTAEMLPAPMRLFWPLFKWATRPDNGASAQRASRSSVYLALSPEVATMNGVYVDPKCKIVPWPTAIHALTVRQQVWQYLENLMTV